jgi:hypothetical protein
MHPRVLIAGRPQTHAIPLAEKHHDTTKNVVFRDFFTQMSIVSQLLWYELQHAGESISAIGIGYGYAPTIFY